MIRFHTHMGHTEIDLVVTGTLETCTIAVVSKQGVTTGQSNLSVVGYLHQTEQAAAPTRNAVEAIGRALYLALPEAVQRAHARAVAAGDLDVRLDVQGLPLAALPWEWMHDGRAFLALTPTINPARRVDGAPVEPRTDALRVLVAIPTGDAAALKQHFKMLVADQPNVHLNFLDDHGKVTLAAIQRELRRSRSSGAAYHVLHLACPLRDDDTLSPYLLLENEQGQPQRAGIDQLKWCAADHALQLVVFAGDVPPAPLTTAGTLPAAAELAQVCAGAVLLPRFPLPLERATLFAAEVYLALADGYTVDGAVAEGRRALVREAGEKNIDWAAPVLFMRAGAQTPAAPADEAGSQTVAAKAPSSPPAQDKNWWQSVPLELWIALLGAATTLLVALIPVTVDMIRTEREAARAGTVVAQSTAPTATPPPSLVTYDIGASVAGFQLPADAAVDPAEADLLIERFYLQLQDDLTASMQPLRFRAGLLGPDIVGRIAGATADEREQNAAELAHTYGADLVVYGATVYDDLTHQLRIQPEYYVAPESFGDALEMTGAFRFGSPVGVALPLNRGLGVERELSARATALAHVMVGLSLYLLERDYTGALAAFEMAAALPGWEAAPGREVIDLLIGNTHMAMAVDASAQCDRTLVLDHVQAALDHFDAAAQIAPAYARAYAGKASAHHLAAWWSQTPDGACETDTIDSAMLQLALDDLDAAHRASEQPKDIGVRSRMLFTEAQVRFAEWLTTAASAGETAPDLPFWPLTAQIIANYENGDHPSVGLVAADAHILRGKTLFALADCWSALDEYDAALAVAEITAEHRMDVLGEKGACYVDLGQPSAATDAYNQALQIARQLNRADDVAYYEAARRQLTAPTTP
jgi:tetratricopeptide (TPR) repeat protein